MDRVAGGVVSVWPVTWRALFTAGVDGMVGDVVACARLATPTASLEVRIHIKMKRLSYAINQRVFYCLVSIS